MYKWRDRRQVNDTIKSGYMKSQMDGWMNAHLGR